MIDHRVPGLAHAPPRDGVAARRERGWRVVSVLALLGTIPAFYLELLHETPGRWPAALYGLAALVVGAGLAHVAQACTRPLHHLRRNAFDIVLAAGLLLAVALPASGVSEAALGLRGAVALATLARILWALRPILSRGSLPYLLLTALGVLGLCGLGFWWLEPRARSFEDGLWLAFTTAATVGYGDIVPTTTASRIFSVFVVLLGLGVLTLVTAAIAAQLVEGEERRIEREILRDMHRQLHRLHDELAEMRQELNRARARQDGRSESAAPTAPTDATAAEAGLRR
jgi:voltage-gated potassium channel